LVKLFTRFLQRYVALLVALAVIWAGAGNRFGHPAASTLDLLAQQGVETLRTDEAGDIEVTVDGQGWRVNARV